jgi:hypothetical protein
MGTGKANPEPERTYRSSSGTTRRPGMRPDALVIPAARGGCKSGDGPKSV